MARKSADCFRMVAMERTRISWVIFACVTLGFSARKTYWGKRNSVSSVPAPSREFCRVVCHDWPLWRSASGGLDLLHGTWTRCAEEPWGEMWFVFSTQCEGKFLLLRKANTICVLSYPTPKASPLAQPDLQIASICWLAPSQLLWLPQAQPLDRVLRAEVTTLVPDRVLPRPAAFSAPGSLCEQLRWSISLWGTYPLLWLARIKAYSYLKSHCSEH